MKSAAKHAKRVNMNEIIVVEQEICLRFKEAEPAYGIVKNHGGDSESFPIHVKVNGSTRFCIHLVVESDAVPCVEACPFDALKRDDSGAVVWWEEDCIGCRLCVKACPYGAIRVGRTDN